jgi:TetR/AcrR family transcriptional regulator
MDTPKDRNDESSRRQAILDAALRVFAQHGFHQATIKQIAQEAGVKSPALIYWYFENKEALLKAIVEQNTLVQIAHAPEAMMDLPPEQVMMTIALNYYKILENPHIKQVLRLFVTESARMGEFAEYLYEFAGRAVIGLITSYLRHQIEVGRLRPHDVESSARALMGMLVAYIITHEIIPPLSRGMTQTPTEYAQTVVSIFLNGLSVSV